MADHQLTPDCEVEEWRSIEGHPYEVSSLGRVRRTFDRHGKWVGRIVKPHRDAAGYLRFTFPHGKERAHVLVCIAFHGPRPSAMHDASHWDGDKTNNVPANIRWATKRENMLDKIRHGTIVRGERVNTAKLRTEDVLQIRRRRGESAKALAVEYGVTADSIDNVRKGRTWAWL